MKETFNMKQILTMLKKHFNIVFIFVFLGLAVSACVTFFILTPKYSSQAQLVVTLPQTNSQANVNDINSNLQMINTYKDFITSDLVLDQVTSRLKSTYKLERTPLEIKDVVAVEQNQNSQMFSIIAKDKNSVNATNIANTVATIFKENAKDVLNVDRITIISQATSSKIPVFPNNKLFLAAGLVLGLFVGVFLALLIDMLDRTVKDSQFITNELGFTILGSVPEISQKELDGNLRKAREYFTSNNYGSSQSHDGDHHVNELRRSRKRV